MSVSHYPWRAPPPNMYRLKPVLGYKNHDFTKKKAPAWSFIRYIPPRQPKPVVSLSPFQKSLMKTTVKKKKPQNWIGAQERYLADGSCSKRKVPYKQKKGKNKMRKPVGDQIKYNKKMDKLSVSSVYRDDGKKFGTGVSTDSGVFQIPPEDLCTLCFPWARTKELPSESTESKSTRKNIKRPPSISGGDEKEGHSFKVLQPGPMVEDIGDPHSAIMLPSGRKIALERTYTLAALPRPPKEDNEYAMKHSTSKHSTKSTKHSILKGK